MTYAFLIVAAVAITLKLFFLTFSLVVTYNNRKDEEKGNTQTTTTEKKKTDMMFAWKKFSRVFMPKLSYCPERSNNLSVKL